MPHLFHTLPLELRIQIYSYILPTYLRSANPLAPLAESPYQRINDYSILNVNRATRIDAGMCYLRSRPFELITETARRDFEAFLDPFPGDQGYASVKDLNLYRFFEDVLEGVGYGNMRLILRCTHLCRLTLWFDSRFSVVDCNDVTSIVNEYQLHRLFALEHLLEIDLRWFFGWRKVGNSKCVEICDEDTERTMRFAEAMGKVEKWLRLGFEQRGRNVEVRICLR